jgi:hypothetical protein
MQSCHLPVKRRRVKQNRRACEHGNDQPAANPKALASQFHVAPRLPPG